MSRLQTFKAIIEKTETLSHFAHSSVCLNITCTLRIPLMSNGWLLTTVTKCRAEIAACSGCTSWCGRASRLRLCWPAGSWGKRPSGRSLANLAGRWWWRWWWGWWWDSGSLFTSWWPYRDGGKRPEWRKGEASLEDDSVEKRERERERDIWIPAVDNFHSTSDQQVYAAASTRTEAALMNDAPFSSQWYSVGAIDCARVNPCSPTKPNQLW